MRRVIKSALLRHFRSSRMMAHLERKIVSREHRCTKSFLSSKYLEDGRHHILLGKNALPLEISTWGFENPEISPDAPAILVSFSGATGRKRRTLGPVFGGREAGRSLGVPVISVSDSTLTLDKDLLHAWYAGNYRTPQLAQRTAVLLDGLSERFGIPLLVTGGSGGGFAALSQGTLLERSAAIVVANPQTSLSHYYAGLICRYLEVAFPTYRRELGEVRSLGRKEQIVRLNGIMSRAGLWHDLISARIKPVHRVLYLQNRGDVHLQMHAFPWMGGYRWRRFSEGSWISVDEGEKGVFVGDWGEGHAALPREHWYEVLRQVVGGSSLLSVLEWLERTPARVKCMVERTGYADDAHISP